MTEIPPVEALAYIAVIMMPVVLLCAWLLHKALWPPRYWVPPPAPKGGRKRPIDQGPETRLMDRRFGS
jgi:hypothetical protein